jgi:alpha-amylase
MSRYEEAYHDALVDAHRAEPASGGVASIHDAVTVKERGLSRLTVPDGRPRRAAVDRFLPPGTRRLDLERGRARGLGDFADARYEFEPCRADGEVCISMRREGSLEQAGACAMEKCVWLDPAGAVRVLYHIRPSGDTDLLFASEWNLAFLTDHMDFVFAEADGSGPVGLGGGATFDAVSGIRITDRLKGVCVSLTPEPLCPIWTYPIETASQSEGGLERVFQGATIVPVWPLHLGAGREARFEVTLRAEPLKE